MAYNPKDYYFKKAKSENYAARSVLKSKKSTNVLKFFAPTTKF